MPFLHIRQPIGDFVHRSMILFLAFAPWFIILTISYEAFFYVVFSATLLLWVLMELRIYQVFSKEAPASDKNFANGNNHIPDKDLNYHTPPDSTSNIPQSTFRPLTLADIRPTLFTLFFVQSGFFSTGNIASISSFSLDAVSRLIPVFEPFSQTALLMFKILIPFAFISAALGILSRGLNIPPGALFALLMAMSDWLTINFFWSVKDEGSWLEIGTTISQFCISSGLCVFLAALEGVSGWLIKGVDWGFVEEKKHANPSQSGLVEAERIKTNMTETARL